MVDIQCPHCEEEIALDDDASGEFVCPHCEGEFEWNIESEDTSDVDEKQESRSSSNSAGLIGRVLSRSISSSFFLAGIVMIVVSVVGFGLSSTLWEATSEPAGVAGAGIVAVMGIALIGFLLSASLGLLGLSIVIAGLQKLIPK